MDESVASSHQGQRHSISASSAARSSEDVETCRICRGEGTKHEPLFYPCKCSGSIKWVHQECLMEWLAHSQKKHCELCKTAFTFTKLYDAEMPQTLPVTIFLRRAGVHVFQNTITVLRAFLVATVWLLWLPWSMRFIWRGLFWLGDGGWAPPLVDASTENGPAFFNLTVPGNFTGVSLANVTFNDNIPHVSFKLPVFQHLNSTITVAPITFTLFKVIMEQFSWVTAWRNGSAALNSTMLEDSTEWEHDSLLSSVKFLTHLTSQPKLNKLIVDILEGQIITLLVVIAFVLVFLIREWVVQQQPIIQGAMVDNEEEARREEQRLARVGGPAAAQVEVEVEEHFNEANEGDDANGINEDTQVADLHGLPGVATTQEVPSDHTGWTIDQLMHDLIDDRDAYRSSANIVGRDSSRIATTARKIAFLCLEALAEASEKEDLEHLRSVIEILARFDETTRSLTEEELGNVDAADVKLSIQALHEWNSVDIWNIQSESAGQRRTSILTVAIELHRRHFAALFPEHEPGPSVIARPSMPDRSHSSLAAMIRREIEENRQVEIMSGPAQGGFERRSSDRSLKRVLSRDEPPEQGSSVEHMLSELKSLDKDILSEDAPASSNEVEDSAIVDLADIPVDHIREADPESVPALPSDQQASQILGGDADAQEQRSLRERMIDWILGDAGVPEPQQRQDEENDERIVQDPAEEEPFVPFADGHLNRHEEIDLAEDDVQDPEVVAAAAEAGIDPNDAEAIEDMEELEGIMELIGMQGPVAGLFQNAVFSSVLISATVTTMVWLPYLWGKVVLLLLANPVQFAIKAPLQILSGTSNFIVDFCIFLGSTIVTWIELALWILLGPIFGLVSDNFVKSFEWIDAYAHKAADSAIVRMAEAAMLLTVDANSDYLHLSVRAHEALGVLKLQLGACLSLLASLIQRSYTMATTSSRHELASQSIMSAWSLLVGLSTEAGQTVSDLHTAFTEVVRSGNLTLNLDRGVSLSPLNHDMVYWDATDRLIAVLAGYGFFAIAGALYLRRGAPFTSSQHGRRFEGILTETLQQAGGVMKVILIIGIEMLIFPLYCGFLLDIAMLPLFAGATVVSRVTFMATSPWTSCFVHWFIGTCYMFNFSLLVSMCRRILRNGVLYFIRDPDDPTFHPVRDVLERSVATQLRKIGFSALVYGALVILCLGSVVWSVYYLIDGILPIEWLSSKPIVAFPVDLLLYNFLTPVVIHLLRPSHGLEVIYEWWFRQCAHLLRLSHFLFGEDRPDEIRHSDGVLNGRYVRAPASDSVRIPKDHSVFLEVTESNARVDEQVDLATGVHGRESNQYTKLYLPPWFRIRIGLFVFCLWALTASVGLGVTVLPLTLGRFMAGAVTQKSGEVNDIYAYFLGIGLLGILSYLISQRRPLLRSAKEILGTHFANVMQATVTIRSVAVGICLTTYTYAALVVVIPTLAAFLLELYLVMPLHAYLHGVSEPYTMYFLQDWTLGVLYIRIAMRIVTARPESRVARALNAIVDKGWLRPDARLATRAFILPSCVVAVLALVAPLPLAWLAEHFYLGGGDDASASAQRIAYPALLAVSVAAYAVAVAVRVARRWRRRIRDEVYLIGERLHNYGEKRQQQGSGRGGSHSVAVGRRLEA